MPLYSVNVCVRALLENEIWQTCVKKKTYFSSGIVSQKHACVRLAIQMSCTNKTYKARGSDFIWAGPQCTE